MQQERSLICLYSCLENDVGICRHIAYGLKSYILKKLFMLDSWRILFTLFKFFKDMNIIQGYINKQFFSNTLIPWFAWPRSSSAWKLRLFKISVMSKLCSFCFSLRCMFRSCVFSSSICKAKTEKGNFPFKSIGNSKLCLFKIFVTSKLRCF